MILVPHEYQNVASRFALANDVAGFFLDPGLGKTSIMLTVIDILSRLGFVEKTLVVAPLRVCHSVWPIEVKKWLQFRDLKVSIVSGDEQQRIEALNTDADIYLINPESIVWLVKQYEEFTNGESIDFVSLPDFQVLIIDESTKFKSPKLKTKNKGMTRFAALKSLIPMFDRRYILTGTPTPKSLIDLWAQVYVLDQGERLGKTISAYRKRWFYPGRHYSEWNLKPGAKEEIEAAIADIVLVMDCRELLDMPELIFNDIAVELPPDVRTAYNKLESELFFELDTDDGLIDETAMTAAAKYQYCKQVASGGLYVEGGGNETKIGATTHDAKLDALSDLHEELNGKPLLVVYNYRHELERLQKRFGGKVPFIAGGVSGKLTNSIIESWNAGSLPLLFCQPQSMSHGLNLQDGGNDMVWFGLTDDLEVYLQMIARLWRQGQTGGVRVHRIIAEDTVDIAIRDRLEEKDGAQRSLLASLKLYREKRLNQRI